MSKTLGDIPRDQRARLATRAEYVARQLHVLASVLEAKSPDMTTRAAYDALVNLRERLDRVVSDIAEYGK